ncbi:MAG: OmpA family protein, partial [Myxococcota bacterium]
DPRGPALLEALAGFTDCGSSRTLASLDNSAALYSFQQEIFNGPKIPVAPEPKRRMIDLDGDGVDDRFDRCARTPSGARVDERGCWVIVDTVFQTDSARIRPDQREALEHAVFVLRQNPRLRIRLDGHTDDTGAAEYNFSLAKRRAEAVRQYILESGISPNRLQVRSFGATRPFADNNSPAGRAANRRVELSVLDD